MAQLDLDKFEYATDELAQEAFVSNSPTNLQSYSEPTIKTEGDYSLKVVADTSSQGKKLSRSLPVQSDLTGVKNLKFDIRSNRTGQNVKVGLYSGAMPTGGTITNDGTDTESDLALHYKMNDNTATTVVVDSSDSADNGTASANTSTITDTGKINECLDLTSDDYVALGTTFVFGDNATVNLWVKDYSVGHVLMGNVDNDVARILFWYTDGNMYTGSNTYLEQVNWSSSGLDFSGWHMFTIKKTANIVEFLFDTVSQGTRILTTIGDITYIGRSKYDAGTDAFVDTLVDDVRFYNRTLSDGDIKALWASGSGTENLAIVEATHNIHTFTTNGTFQTSNDLDVKILVVAGGGGGGDGSSSPGNCGGGGAGGVIYDADYTIIAGSYPIQIGDGGEAGLSGDDTIFNDLTAIAGGAGGTYPSPSGQNGGSGGGAGQANTYGAGTTGQGNDGGSSGYGGGGGGGASEVGQNAQDVYGNFENGGKGGDGIQSDISGANTHYGGGGGGSTHYDGSARSNGGLGGGGKGAYAYSSLPGEAGTDGLGGGGGAGGEYQTAGAGGSGVVIIRYTIPTPTLVTEITPDIVVADQFQTINFDISAIDDVDKSAIGSVKVEIVNDDSANTFYLDNLIVATCIDMVGLIG